MSGKTTGSHDNCQNDSFTPTMSYYQTWQDSSVICKCSTVWPIRLIQTYCWHKKKVPLQYILLTLKCNFQFDVNKRFESTWWVTLYYTFGVGAYSSTIFSSHICLMTGSVLFCIISSSSSPYKTIAHDSPLSKTSFNVLIGLVREGVVMKAMRFPA